MCESQKTWNSLIANYKKYCRKLGHSTLNDLFPVAPNFNPLDPNNFDKLADHLLKLKKQGANLTKASKLRQLHFDSCIKDKQPEEENHQIARLKYNDATEQTIQLITQLEECQTQVFDSLPTADGKTSLNGGFEYISDEILNKKSQSYRRHKKKKNKKKKVKSKTKTKPIIDIPKDLGPDDMLLDALNRFSYLDFLTQRYHQTNLLLAKLNEHEIIQSVYLMYLCPEMYTYLFDPLYSYQGKNIISSKKQRMSTDVWNEDWPNVRYNYLIPNIKSMFTIIFSHMLKMKEKMLDEMKRIDQDPTTLGIFIMDTWHKVKLLQVTQGLVTTQALATRMTFLLYLFLSDISLSMKFMHENGFSDRMGGLRKHINPEFDVYELLRDKFIDKKYSITHYGLDDVPGTMFFDKYIYNNELEYDFSPKFISETSLFLMVDYMAVFGFGKHMTGKYGIPRLTIHECKGTDFKKMLDTPLSDITSATNVARQYSKGLLVNKAIDNLLTILPKKEYYRMVRSWIITNNIDI